MILIVFTAVNLIPSLMVKKGVKKIYISSDKFYNFRRKVQSTDRSGNISRTFNNSGTSTVHLH